MTTRRDPEQAAEWIGFLMRELRLEPGYASDDRAGARGEASS